MRRRTRARLIRGGLYTVLVVAVAAAVQLADWDKVQSAFFKVDLAREMFPEIVTIAAKNTLIYTVLAFLFGLGLGLVLALMRLSTIAPYRWIATVYIEVFRGLPALVTITIIGFGIPIAFGREAGLESIYTKAMVALGIVAAAYMAETIRAGILAVPRGQLEAARSLGMTYPRAMVSIVFPQAFRVVIPPLTNEFVLLIKDTALLFVLGVTPLTKELYRFGQDLASDTFNSTPLTVSAVMYLLVTIPLTRLVSLLELRAARAR